MKNTGFGSGQEMTRRGFLAKAGLAGVAGAAAICMPDVAFASQGQQTAEERNATALKLWEKAVGEAELAGEEVHEGILPSGNFVVPYAYTNGSATKWINVGGLPTLVGAVAVYEANSRIEAVYDAWITVSYGSVSNLTYKWTRIDAGRTLAVNYTCTLTNPIGLNEGWTFYAEFGTSGSGWIA